LDQNGDRYGTRTLCGCARGESASLAQSHRSSIYSTEFVLLGLCDRLELYRLTVADGEPPKHTRGGMRSWPHPRVSGSPAAFPQSEGPALGLNAGNAKAAERNPFHRSRPRPDRLSRFRKTAQSAPHIQKTVSKGSLSVTGYTLLPRPPAGPQLSKNGAAYTAFST